MKEISRKGINHNLHLNNLHVQIISSIILVFCILYLKYAENISTWGMFTYLFKKSIGKINIFTILISAVLEELIFRGVLISFFQKKFRDFRVSIYLSALLFGISYYLATHDIGQAAYFFVLGIIFGYLRIQEPEKFTLFSLILAHFLFNIFSNLIV